MPRGVHPNSLANLRIWSPIFHPSGLGLRARKAKALSRPKTLNGTLNQPDSEPGQDTSEITLVRKRIAKAEKMYDRERIPLRLEQLAGTIAKLRQIERKLGSSPASTPARPAVKAKPTYLE
jgi:hypothetical protein